MAITAAGVGSGLDINGIVSQLMSLERRPLFQLERKIDSYETQLSAYGKVRSALSAFGTAMEGLSSLDKFQVYAADSSDEDVLTASADSSVTSGVFSMEVTRLAQNHKLGSSQSILKADTFSGNLSVTVDGNTMNVSTDGLTLEGIRDKINSDETNPGVTATVINTGGDNQTLILTSEESGTAKAITVDETAVNNVTQGVNGSALGLSMLNRDKDGVVLSGVSQLDAEYKIDGITLTSASNEASGAIEGITLNLKALGSSTLNISRDTEAIKESAQEFVDAYNALRSTLNDLATDELAGDSSIRSLQDTIRNVYNSASSGFSGTFTSLAQLGITTDVSSGELRLDSNMFEDALDTDFDSVAQLFANDTNGYAFKLAEIADSLSGENGVVKSREEGLRSRISYSEDRVLSMEARLELTETALRAKYASLDSLIGSMQSTMQFVSTLG